MGLEIELDGHTYRIGKLDAIKQWHVFRRLIPVLGSFSGLFSIDQDVVRSTMLNQFLPVFKQLGAMSDLDTDFVLNTCLSVVTRKDTVVPDGWQRVMIQPGHLQFDDIEMVLMLQLTKYVVMENLSSFFTQAASADSPEAGQQPGHSSQ